MIDRWADAMERIERELPRRVASADVVRLLTIVRDDPSFGPIALEHVASTVEALPIDPEVIPRVEPFTDEEVTL